MRTTMKTMKTSDSIGFGVEEEGVWEDFMCLLQLLLLITGSDSIALHESRLFRWVMEGIYLLLLLSAQAAGSRDYYLDAWWSQGSLFLDIPSEDCPHTSLR